MDKTIVLSKINKKIIITTDKFFFHKKNFHLCLMPNAYLIVDYDKNCSGAGYFSISFNFLFYYIRIEVWNWYI